MLQQKALKIFNIFEAMPREVKIMFPLCLITRLSLLLTVLPTKLPLCHLPKETCLSQKWKYRSLITRVKVGVCSNKLLFQQFVLKLREL